VKSAFFDRAQKAIPIECTTSDKLAAWLKPKPARVRKWVKATGFSAKPGTHCLIPSDKADIASVLVGVPKSPTPWDAANLPATLPKGKYSLAMKDATRAEAFAFGWGAGTYRFSRYKQQSAVPSAQLQWPKGVDKKAIERTLSGTFLVRDLVNTPAEDMGPGELASTAKKLAQKHGARVEVTVGDSLKKKNFPMIHAVGRASDRAPRLIDMKWGRKGPKVVIVGKGVCFDTGGLDLKQPAGMLLMKKDMGGAAHALGLAQMVMAAKLPVRLRVLVPAVDNAVAGNAIRPSDVVMTRKGLSVEIGNTDAEGRLVLCDALAFACEDKPDYILDFATLTGAARVALGTDLPALFCNNEKMAEQLLKAAKAQQDPLWRMPLVGRYRSMLRSHIADTNNIGSMPYGGAITAALYLQKFVTKGTPWAHVDLMAYNLAKRAGRPVGGEAMGLRASFRFVQQLCE